MTEDLTYEQVQIIKDRMADNTVPKVKPRKKTA